MSRLADILQQKRKEKGLTVSDINKITAIKAPWIKLLEEGKFEEMPSYVHAHGFLAQYAKAVGLNFEKEVKPLFDEECPKARFGLPPEEDVSAEDDKKPPEQQKNFMFAVFIIILAIAVAVFLRMRDKAPLDVAPVPAVSPALAEVPEPQTAFPEAPLPQQPMGPPVPMPLPAPATPEPVTPVTTAPGEAVPAKYTATLIYTDNCWTRVETDRGYITEFTATDGIRRIINFDKYFKLDIGSAAAISINVGTETFANLGRAGQPVMNYYIVASNGAFTVARARPQ